MTVLLIQILARSRLSPRRSTEAGRSDERAGGELTYVLADEAGHLQGTGRVAPALLPKADRVLAVLAETDVSWHRITVPKAPPARLRAALAGLMEEALLDDEEQVHFAIAPDAVPGQPGWVGVLHRGWLQAQLTDLARHGLEVDQVVPSLAPPATAAAAAAPAVVGHFFIDESLAGVSDDAVPTLALQQAGGVGCLRLAGSLARAALPEAEALQGARWTATPAAAAAAERWLGSPVAVSSESEHLLQALRSPWELRQFDLAPRHRGTLALRDAVHRFLSRDWRPVRWGLAALLVVQVLGLNVWAWQQRQAIEQRRQAMVQLLQGTHPQVRAVLDAPLQMQRETERLRAAAGRPGVGDFEMLLAVASAAWPEGQGPVQTLKFETGRLTLAAPGWQPAQLQQFRERLRPTGFGAELAEGRLVITRASAAPLRSKA